MNANLVNIFIIIGKNIWRIGLNIKILIQDFTCTFFFFLDYSGTLGDKHLLSQTNLFMNKFSEQKMSSVTNGVQSEEHTSQ